MTDDNHDGPVDRALDLFVYAPLGLAALARDTLPGLVQGFAARGRAEIGRRRHAAEEKIGQARTVGRFAVDYGAPMVRQHVEARLQDARGRAEQTFSGLVVPRDETAWEADAVEAFAETDSVTSAVDVVEASESEPVESVPEDVAAESMIDLPVIADPVTAQPEPLAGVNGSAAPSPVGLPIPDYDELSASQVVSRLPGLAPDELEAIRTYEAHGRGRRTILGKIDQLVR